ncbi:hypothetical protein F4780DRAFT_603734 [Xylariomycetidae sp. FL0641]|nr:hypothetical protein F4780DRAFT_603734 [Xylariomycetidae sp. FL0641]
MARSTDEKSLASSSSGSHHASLLYESLEQYNQEQKRRKRPAIILGALLCLFLSAGGGIAVGVLLMLQPVEAQAACLSRDLILFSSGMTLLYIILHLRGARKDYRRSGPGPPQIYGNYLHASALLIARLGLCIWITALVATVVMIVKAVPFTGWADKLPFLDILICVGAIPPFLVICVTIEKHQTPFATAAVSRNSFLTCRVSEFADDLAADMSVSRRASLQRKESQTGSSVLTVPTEEIFHLGAPPKAEEGRAKKLPPQPLGISAAAAAPEDDDKTELMAGSPLRASHHHSTKSSMPPPPPSSEPVPPVPPLPAYHPPGGWRDEWNHVADEVGVSQIASGSSSSSSSSASFSSCAGPSSTSAPTSSSCYTSHYSSSDSSAASSSSSRRPLMIAGGSKKKKTHHHRARASASASTSIASSAARSRLATVRYAAHPEVAVRQPIRVVRNPAFPGNGNGNAGAALLLRSAQREQQTRRGGSLKRSPSNFSRPIPRREEREKERERVKEKEIDVRVPGAYVEDAGDGR